MFFFPLVFFFLIETFEPRDPGPARRTVRAVSMPAPLPAGSTWLWPQPPRWALSGALGPALRARHNFCIKRNTKKKAPPPYSHSVKRQRYTRKSRFSKRKNKQQSSMLVRAEEPAALGATPALRSGRGGIQDLGQARRRSRDAAILHPHTWAARRRRGAGRELWR